MKKFFVILCLFNVFVGINLINAQRRTLDTPSKFKDPKEESNLALTNDETTIAEPWTVFSDKSGNVSYIQPNAGTVKKKLGFLDLFYVVGISGDWLNIFKGEINEDGSLKTNAQDYGWVKSENLLLWKKCLKKNEISRKALLLNSFEGLKSADIVKGQGRIVKFYKDPSLSVLTDKENNLFEIYFIYKQTATSYLLGKDERIYILENPQSSIYGWVSKSKVTPWDHRVALIPNTKEYAIADRKSKNIRARIFNDLASATKNKDNKAVNAENIIWDNDEYRSTYPGTFMRFPILSSSKDIENNNSILKVMAMGQIASKKNKFKRYQLSSIGYVNVSSIDLSYPLFEPVLFMTSQDLSAMITVMTSFVDASKNDERRQNLKETWVELLKKYMGNVNISEIENLSMEQINFNIFGLPYTSDLLKGLKLKDIEDKSIFDDVILAKWINKISLKIKNLSKMQNISDDNSSFLTNDQRYFWIEQNLLP